MGNACTATIKIKNDLNDTMTLNDANLSDGKWSKYPKESLTPGFNDTAAKAESKDCAMIGPEGYIKYGIPDGTTFMIRFSVPYGNSDNYLHCTAEGSKAGRYKISIDDFSADGKSPSGTITVSR